jgi:hypothetical protein
VLAIFDDLDTVLFLIPLQMLFVGLRLELIVVAVVIVVLLVMAYRWLHVLRWPVGKWWLLGYGAIVVVLCQALERGAHVHLEVLLPAFALGCMLRNPHDPAHPKDHPHEHTHLEPEAGSARVMDRLAKALFMFLVGCSLPRVAWGSMGLGTMALHVGALTLLSNVGKCFPAFCYRQEAPLRHRIALSIAMFPRGEVGAGVLLVALGYGLGGFPTTLAALSLALNLLLTGVFIALVIRLLGHPGRVHLKS